MLLDEVVDVVVAPDGAAVELVVAVDVVVAVPVSVDVLAEVDAVVDSVVELDVDVVVDPQAARAINAPAAAKLRNKRMLSSSRKMGTRRHRRPNCQRPWRNLTKLKVTAKRPADRPIGGGICRFPRSQYRLDDRVRHKLPCRQKAAAW